MHLKTCIAAMDAPTAPAVAIAGLHPPHVVPGQRAEDFLDPCLEEQDKDEDLLDSPWIPTPRFCAISGTSSWGGQQSIMYTRIAARAGGGCIRGW